jgi:hypothetical protein
MELKPSDLLVYAMPLESACGVFKALAVRKITENIN